MSNWYAIHCVSGKEEAVRSRLAALFSDYRTFFPRRELEIRKGGEISREIKALFPGYLFLQTGSRLMNMQAAEISGKINSIFSSAALLKIVGMVRNQNSLGSDEIPPIHQREIDMVLEMTDQNEIVQFSTYRKTGEKIRIVKGPLANLEGIIVKVNARKKRMKVAIELLGTRQIVDLGAEMIL